MRFPPFLRICSGQLNRYNGGNSGYTSNHCKEEGILTGAPFKTILSCICQNFLFYEAGLLYQYFCDIIRPGLLTSLGPSLKNSSLRMPPAWSSYYWCVRIQRIYRHFFTEQKFHCELSAIFIYKTSRFWLSWNLLNSTSSSDMRQIKIILEFWTGPPRISNIKSVWKNTSPVVSPDRIGNSKDK